MVSKNKTKMGSKPKDKFRGLKVKDNTIKKGKCHYFCKPYTRNTIV